MTTSPRILAAPPGCCRRRGTTLRYNDLQGNIPLALIDLDNRYSFALLIISAASFGRWTESCFHQKRERSKEGGLECLAWRRRNGGGCPLLFSPWQPTGGVFAVTKKVYDYMTTNTTGGEGVALLSLFIAPYYIRDWAGQLAGNGQTSRPPTLAIYLFCF